MNKTSLFLGALMLLVAGIFARLLTAARISVPVGYQDETGFHTGVKKPEKESSWPQVW